MGNAVVDTQLYYLGVYHDQFYVFRVRFVENAHNQRIDTDGFSRPRSACNEKVRHFGNIRHHGFPGDIFSHCKSNIGFMAFKFLGGNKFPERNNGIFRIGNLDSHRRFSGNRCFDPDIRHCQVLLDIICQAHNLADLYPLIRLDLVAGHRRSPAYVRYGNADAEIP